MAVTAPMLIFAAVSAATSVAGALAANENAEDQHAVEKKQISTKARVEDRELHRSMKLYQDSLRTSAATRGVGVQGSTAALATSAILQTLEQSRTVAKNKHNALQASVSRANSQMQSPLLQGIIGGLQGMAMGASLFPGADVLGGGGGGIALDTLIPTDIPGVPGFGFA